MLLRQTLLTHSESSSAFSSFVVEHEEPKPCAYQDDTGETLIGFRLLLKSKETREFFKIIGANYDIFYNNATTLKKDVCLCSRVPCLSKEQIAILLDMKIEEVLSRTTSLIPSFESLCFRLQSVFVDIAYSSTRNGFEDIVRLIADKLYQGNWLAIANILKTTQWCRKHKNRCARNRNLVLKGCKEGDKQRNRRHVKEHRDLEFASFSFCCKGKMFHESINSIEDRKRPHVYTFCSQFEIIVSALFCLIFIKYGQIKFKNSVKANSLFALR